LGSSDQLCISARNVGASGATRAELLRDLVGILSLYRVMRSRRLSGARRMALVEAG
jgi:hypothetical protein